MNSPQIDITRRRALGAASIGAVGLAVSSGWGQPAQAAPSGRFGSRTVSFDGDWRFHRGAAEGAEAPGFDDSGWRRLDLPHDWSIEDLPGAMGDGGATTDPALVASVVDPTLETRAPSRIGPHDRDDHEASGDFGDVLVGGKFLGYTQGGEGWYRKQFRVENLQRGEQVSIRFDGIYCNSDVWINGKHVGHRPNGYIVAHYDLTPHLRRGRKNVLAVRVRNLGVTSRWYSGSGIYRHTWLTRTGPVRIPEWGVGITTPRVTPRRSTVKTVVKVDNRKRRAMNVRTRCTLMDPSGRIVATRLSKRRLVKPGKSTMYRLKQSVRNAKLWSLDKPHLYRARVEVIADGKVVDKMEESFGIRSIKMSDKGFFLNGKSVKMRGANIHHDHGPLGAMALDRSEERRVRILKEAGFNAVRSSHNAPNPALLDACDRLGMLVYDELFDTWDQNKASRDYGDHFTEWWRRDTRDWVLTGRNHPSVVIRSLGNEIAFSVTPGGDTSALKAQGAAIAALVRKLDPTRPLCQGGAQGISEREGQESDTNYADSYTDVGDIHYAHTYADKPAANPAKAWLQSESYPTTMYEDYALLMAHDYAIGDFVWTGWDYIGEAGIGNPAVKPSGTEPPDDGTNPVLISRYPVHLAGCGDFDVLGRPRPQLLYRRVVWGKSPLELLVERPVAPGLEQHSSKWAWRDELESWTWDVLPAPALKVHAYSRADRVELLLNGRSIGTVNLTDADKCTAEFAVPYEPGQLTAVAYQHGKEIARKTLETVGPPAKLRLRSDVPRLTTSRGDLSHVLVEVTDAQGRLVPDAVVEVAFAISGGKLIGVGNGNRNNVDSWQQPRRWTYLGAAMAIVRPPKKPGTLRLTATAEGLTGATLTLKVSAQRGRGGRGPLARAEDNYRSSVMGGAVAVAAGSFLRVSRRRSAALSQGGS